VAFVRPTFTYAAYQLNGFYNFYSKYIDPQPGTNITTDLNLLTVKVPHGPFLLHNQVLGDVPSIPEKEYIDTLMQHVKQKSPYPINISDITDKEVNDGLIFNHTKNADSNNDTNAYDVLFLFHQEYATQAEYYNLKRFVENGGTIVFNDANILTTEVKYNESADTITLVKGHDWQYNGKTAWPSVRERWPNDTREWVGSNFLQDPTKDNVTFSRDYFGYKHAEEQYATNPKDKIILDFGAQVISPIEAETNGGAGTHPTVAIYELDHLKGKVIMIGIFGHKLVKNNEFLDFYDNAIIPAVF
jgi:hypothetical protein